MGRERGGMREKMKSVNGREHNTGYTRISQQDTFYQGPYSQNILRVKVAHNLLI